MLRTLIYPSSGACDCAVELPHRSFCSRFVVCWRFGAAGFEWCPCCRMKLDSGLYSCPLGYVREFLLLFLHWIPLNLIILKVDVTVFWA